MPTSERDSQVAQLSFSGDFTSVKKQDDEPLFHPEGIRGSKFSVGSIEGLGSGRGFALRDFSLPIGWEKAQKTLQSRDTSRHQEIYDHLCDELGIEAGEVVYDPETGLLVRLELARPSAIVELGLDFMTKRDGTYAVTAGLSKEREIPTIEAAFVLQREIGQFLGTVHYAMGSDQEVPYIDSSVNANGIARYFSANLRVPTKLLEREGSITNPHFRKRLQERASNIAGRFGLSAKDILFTEQGIPKMFGVVEGNACQYDLHLDGLGGDYHPHNVDTLYQAAAIHGMTADFLNYFNEVHDFEEPDE